MKKKGGKVHVSFECGDCGKIFDAMNGQGLAAQHAKKYKHCVIGEVVFGFVYDGKDIEENIKD